MNTIKFWTNVNGNYIKIKLTEGETVTHNKWEKTEEGFDSRVLSWEFDGETVMFGCYRRGRDCDGPYSSTMDLCAHMSELAVQPGYNDDTVMTPYWQDADRYWNSGYWD